MKTPEMFRRLVAMIVTIAMTLSLCAPVLAEMPSLPDLSPQIALLSQTNGTESIFDIGQGDIWIEQITSGMKGVKVGEKGQEKWLSSSDQIVITGSTDKNRIHIKSDIGQTLGVMLDKVNIEYESSPGAMITVENGSLELIFRGENKIKHIYNAVAYRGENFSDTLTIRGETADSKLEIASVENAIFWKGNICFQSGQLEVSQGGTSNTDVIFYNDREITIEGGSVRGRKIRAGTDVTVTGGKVDINELFTYGSLSVTGGSFWAHTSPGRYCMDIRANVTIGNTEGNPVEFRAEGNATPMEIGEDLLIQGDNTKVYIGGGADGIKAHGMVIKGGILDISGIHCNGGEGEISGNTCIKTYSLINNGKKVQVGENVRMYLTSNDRSGYLQTDFRGGTGWIVYDGDGDDMHVIPTYYTRPEQSQVQDPANYKNVNLNPGAVPDSYKIGDGSIEIVVCEDGSQLVYQANNEAGYAKPGSSVKIISSGKSSENFIKITRREGSSARASVVLDNLNLYSRDGDHAALEVECPAEITVERSSSLLRAWYAKCGVSIKNADVTFKTDANSTLTIGAGTGIYCENSTVKFEDAAVNITGSNSKPAISGQNSKVVFGDGSKAKLRMLEDDSGVTATVGGSAMVYVSEQWEMGTALTTTDFTSGWLLYGDKDDPKGLPDGCYLPKDVDLDEPVTYKPFAITTSFDVYESSVVVNVAENGQRTVNWNGQDYSIWDTSKPITITCSQSTDYHSIKVTNASLDPVEIVLDNVNINCKPFSYQALYVNGAANVTFKGNNSLVGNPYGIASYSNGSLRLIAESDGAELDVQGNRDGANIVGGSLFIEGGKVSMTGGERYGINSNSYVTIKGKANVKASGPKAAIFAEQIVSITDNSVVNTGTGATTDTGGDIVGSSVSISGAAKVRAKKITSGTVTIGGTSRVYLLDQPDAEAKATINFEGEAGNGWLVYDMDGTRYSVPAGLDLSSLRDDTDPADYQPLTKPETGYDITVTHGVADHAKAEEGTSVTVTAVTPKDGKSYKFVKWTVISPEGLTPETGTLNDLTFTFKMPGSAVELKAEWEETGPAPQPTKEHNIMVLYGMTDPASAEKGTTIKATTMAPAGGGRYTFKGWTVEEPEGGLEIVSGSLDDLTFEFEMPDCDVELTANWEKTPAPDPDPEPTRYTVTVINGYADHFRVKKGDVVTATTIWPEDGGDYIFKGWTVDSLEELTITDGSLNDFTFAFEMPENNVQLTAVWEKAPGPTTQYSVTVTNGIADHLQAEKDTAIRVMTVQPKDEKNYEFKGWTVNKPEELTITDGTLDDLTFTFTMPESDVELTANWEEKDEPEPKPDPKPEEKQYAVTVTGGTTDHAKAERNTSVEVTAVQPDDGKNYVFKGWTVNKPEELTIERGSLEQTSFIFRMPESDVELTAVWKEETEPEPESDGGGAVVAVLATGALAWGGYEAVTRILLSQKLPEGAEIPASRSALALLIWQTAGRPEPEKEPAFPDRADMTDEVVKAAQWCTEQGLMEVRKDGCFAPDEWVPKFRVIEIWDKAFPE